MPRQWHYLRHTKALKRFFSAKNASHLLHHEDCNNAIDFVKSKQRLYKSDYSLHKNELSIFEPSIDKNLVNCKVATGARITC